jgi:hypothetical protein
MVWTKENIPKNKTINGIVTPLSEDEKIEQPSQEAIDAKVAEFDKEIPLNLLRLKRNKLLAKTDWTANSDVTMSDAMKTYRQQLRDATEGLDTVEKVQAYEFPTEVTK